MIDKLDSEHEKNIHGIKLQLIDKLFVLVNGRIASVTNILGEEIIPRGTKFTQKLLERVDFSEVNPSNWTTDKDKNEQIERLLHNFMIKYNDLLGQYKREKFQITVGDELPAGIVQLAKVSIAQKRKLKVGDKWQDVTVTKVSLLVLLKKKICHSLKTAQLLTLY